MELTSINGSLSVLGQCISALAESKRTHIPFRNAKLTRVLKSSLCGNSNIALFVNITSSMDSYRETLSTLMVREFASIFWPNNTCSSQIEQKGQFWIVGSCLRRLNQGEKLSQLRPILSYQYQIFNNYHPKHGKQIKQTSQQIIQVPLRLLFQK